MFWVDFLQKCHVIWTPTSQSDCWPGVLLAGNQLTDTGGDSDNDVNVKREEEVIIENQSNSSFILRKNCLGKTLSTVEMFGEISGDCRQMGIYLVSHISILPSQPSPPSLYFVNNTVHKEGKKKNNKVFFFYFSSTTLNLKCRLQTM